MHHQRPILSTAHVQLNAVNPQRFGLEKGRNRVFNFSDVQAAMSEDFSGHKPIFAVSTAILGFSETARICNYAACRDTAPELFFPVGTTGAAIDQIESAKRLCDSCDANKACLEFALATNQESGVWGGTTEDERKKLRKQWLAARRKSLAN